MRVRKNISIYKEKNHFKTYFPCLVETLIESVNDLESQYWERLFEFT